jgi:SAM-dependent methyltransferase
MTDDAQVFVRGDGRRLSVLPGFRERVLGGRRSVTPRDGWSDDEYGASADRKLARFARLRAEFEGRTGPLEDARVLEMGCGDGINCLLLAHAGAGFVQGVDLAPALLEDSDRGERARRLADVVLTRAGFGGDHEAALAQLPVDVRKMDVTALDLPDASFDLAWSRSVLEHVMPVDRALAEGLRVVRPGGLLHHRIDPFYGIRGCHKRGVVDIPWAHARLDLEDFRRFVAETEGEDSATQRHTRLRTLNQLCTQAWHAVVVAGEVELLDWTPVRSEQADEVLAELPGLTHDLLDGLSEDDLVYSELKVWLRRTPDSA